MFTFLTYICGKVREFLWTWPSACGGMREFDRLSLHIIDTANRLSAIPLNEYGRLLGNDCTNKQIRPALVTRRIGRLNILPSPPSPLLSAGIPKQRSRVVQVCVPRAIERLIAIRKRPTENSPSLPFRETALYSTRLTCRDGACRTCGDSTTVESFSRFLICSGIHRSLQGFETLGLHF